MTLPPTPARPTQWASACSRRRLACRLAGLAGTLWLPAASRAGPEPNAGLCGNAPHPAYPAVDQPASVQSWLPGHLHDGPGPDCSVLQGRDFELLVRLTASFNLAADLDGLLTRMGAVSAMKGASYWSFTDRKRQLLFKEAYAVDSAGSLQPRPDFTATELRTGQELVFVNSDNRSSKLQHYGMRLAKITPDLLRLQVENLDELRMYGLLVASPRETQWSVTLERLGPGRWGYRSLLGQRRLRLGRNEQHRLSNLARSVAMFDLLAGRQTDSEGHR